MAGPLPSVPRRWLLAVLSAASFLAVLDTTVVSIALPTVASAVGLSAGQAPWVLTAYALAFGSLLLPLGRVADTVGRRPLFGAGLLVFAAASVLAGLAGHPAVLIAARLVQGVGSAAFVPASLALLTALHPDRDARSRALAVYGAMAAVGFVVGMVGGGFVTAIWGWRWVFLGVVPLAVACAAATARIPRSADAARNPQPPKVVAAVVLLVGLVLVVVALDLAGRGAAAPVGVVVSAAVGVVLVVGLVRRERGRPDALVPWDVLSTRRVAGPNLALTLQSMVGIAWLYVLTLAFQVVRGTDALTAGLLFAPMTAAALVGATVAGRVVVAVGAPRAAVVGQAAVVLGVVVMIVGVPGDRPVQVLVAGSVIGECGFMLSNVGLTVCATTAFPDGQSGMAAALVNSAAQLGGAVGLAVTGAVVAGVTGAAEGRLAAGLQAGLAGCVVFGSAALAVAVSVAREERRVPARRHD